MFYVLVLLFPGMIASTIYHGLLKDKRKIEEKLWDACLFSVFINFLDILIVTFVFKNHGDIMTPLYYSSTYLVKYLLLSFIFAITLSFIAFYFRKAISIKIEIKNAKK